MKLKSNNFSSTEVIFFPPFRTSRSKRYAYGSVILKVPFFFKYKLNVSECHDLTPASIYSSVPHAATRSLLFGWKRELESKREKNSGLSNNCLASKAKAMFIGKGKQGIRSLLAIGRQIFSCLQDSSPIP